MSLVKKLDQIIHLLAQPKYLVPAGLILGGLILLSLILSSFSRSRKRNYK